MLLWIGLYWQGSREFQPQAVTVDTDPVPHPLTSTTEAIQLKMDDFQAIVDRPLFSESRRPFVPDAIVPETTVATKKAEPPRRHEDYKLTAVIITPEQRIALVQQARESKPRHVKLNDTLDGWTVAAIEPQKLTLTRGGDTRTVMLALTKSATSITAVENKSEPGSSRSPDRETVQEIIPDKITAVDADAMDNPDSLIDLAESDADRADGLE